MKKGESNESHTSAEIDLIFEEILTRVGKFGKFQKMYLTLFSFASSFIMGMGYLNIMLAMTVPGHWCHVPRRQQNNHSLEAWKNITIPRNGLNGEYSSCEMYLPSRKNISNSITVGCMDGWDFDDTWYTSTAPSQEQWICENAITVSNVLSGSCVGYVLGGLVGGHISDKVGRKPIFILTLLGLLLGRSVLVFSAGTLWIFILAAVLGNMSVVANYQTVMTAGVEIMAQDKKQLANVIQFTGWTLGHITMPLIAWATGNWQTFILISTAPAFILMLFCCFFPESPRWLATTGKSKDCIIQWQKIARLNGNTLSVSTLAEIEKIDSIKETSYGIASLFSSWRLVRNTTFLCLAWISNCLTYFIIILKMSTMSGNPFLNYVYQGIVEIPANFLAVFLSDRLGRRWVHAGSFLLQIPFFALLAICTPGSIHEWVPILFLVVVKFCISVTYYVVYLQTMEMYPTCVRQSGAGFAEVLGSSFTVLGPYAIYLGTNINSAVTYVLLIALCLLGIISSLLVPETLNYQLPETLLDAKDFGKDQRFWSLPPHKKMKEGNVTTT